MKDIQDVICFTSKLRILYVEDEVLLRESTISILEDLFLEVIVADNGEEGLEKFYDNQIDIVLSDVNMPKLDGLEMSTQLRNFDINIPIILLSAHSELEYFSKAMQLDIDGYLLKPIQIDKLIDSFEKCIKKIDFINVYNNNLAFLKQYQELTDLTSAVSKADIHGDITYVNDAFIKLSGFLKEELMGSNHNIIRHPDNKASMYTDLWHSIKYKKEPWKGVLRSKSKNNGTYYVNSVITPILDINNEIVEYISMQHDITNIISPKKQLYDFVDSASNPMIVLIKIDGFSDIEKLYGHNITENIEASFAKDLLKHMPEYLNFDKFYSLGSGEYAFVQDLEYQKEMDTPSILNELKNFQYIMNELKIEIGEIDYDVAIIMSIANGKDCLENVKYGIDSLFKSKQDFVVSNDFAKIEQDEAFKNLQILKMVKVAIENGKIISFFQPIVCNKTQKVVKYESLVRLVDEEENIVAPFFFLDIAKKGKYYSRITGMVLENSFNALKQTDKAITINISALDIEKYSTRKKIYELLDAHKSEAFRIVFELLEDEDVKDFDEIEKFILSVKEYGVKIAIDDFGAGYSNFERLLKYQPDILKIDGSLIKNIESDAYSMSVVKSIVAFAKEQGIEMVAEYIENENIYIILKNLGVEYSQGYYFGKPDFMDMN
ncbi:MAG: PAS domain S-box-containing protein [Sulfurimonas sp.]|jgi:PAS domain S-box-containing protein|uniref:EAL domain-containing response regulator n=1 Tax=Sulfurimonas sp. TaxID=2022749 RepID=UPI0039E6E8DA